MANWHQLELFFKKKTNAKKFSKLLLENIEGTIHEKQGAAEVRFQKSNPLNQFVDTDRNSHS